MADMPLYEGETIMLRWGRLQWECQMYRHDALCVKCGGATVRIDPPWETWRLLCCAESALTMSRVEYRAAIDTLQPGAVGFVTCLPVHVHKKEQQEMPTAPNHNDKALVDYFVRGMRRFEKHVRAEERSETADEGIEARIEAAYRLARAQCTPTPQH